MTPEIVCVVGPTASGKTKMGVAIAKAFNGEVVSVDSMQIYRGMTVGTAAPTDPTEKPTDPTDAPEMPTEAPTDEPKPGKKGCGSVLGLSALAAVVSAGWMLRKKREE